MTGSVFGGGLVELIEGTGRVSGADAGAGA
jgi:hypothetical protein